MLKMFVNTLLTLITILKLAHAEDYLHDPIQYHSQSPAGSYKYGYDTGLYGAHQFHQEKREPDGTVRGKYGYTDPTGKLRLVHYTSGPGGYRVWQATPSSSYEYGTSTVTKSKIVAQKLSDVPDGSYLKSGERLGNIVEVKGGDILEVKGTQQIVNDVKGAQKIEELKGGYQKVQSYYSPVKQLKSRYVVSDVKGNQPVPVTPAQYKEFYQPNYPPSGKYSKCICV